jgi:NADH-quinone oxidoreductase subunit G
MPTATINGKEVTVPPGTPVIRAAAMVGVNIPHFCYHPALSAPANCRMCLVEIEGARKLEPACYAKVSDGMVVETESEKVHHARKAVLEFILINHPVDCPICDQAGECKLQDYYMAYDAQPSRLTTNKVGKAKVYPIGPEVVYDGERCILCTRCVRFCDEITGTSELTVVERGDHSEIRTFPGQELDNDYSMNVTDICPVGALTTRDFRFKCRVWLLKSTDSICTGCAKGCNIHLEHHLGEVQRYRPRFNPQVNEYWMCDDGRLSYKKLHRNRALELRFNGDESLTWPRVARSLGQEIAATNVNEDEVAFVVSAQESNETLLAAKHYAETVLDTENFFFSAKEDGKSDAFLISSDKNPNRRGVKTIYGDDIQDADALLNALEAGSIKLLFMMRTELPFDDDEKRARFEKALKNVDNLVVLAMHNESFAKDAATVLPLSSHAEYDGSFINEEGYVQPFTQGFSPLGKSLPGYEIFLRLAHGADAELPFDDFEGIQDALYAEEEEEDEAAE